MIQSAKTPRSATQGFTLVEALIAGVLMTFVMTSVGRLSVTALASSSNQKERSRIEGAIENSIQKIQNLDSQLTDGRIHENHRKKNDPNNACIAPGAYLAHRLAYGVTTSKDWQSDSIKKPDAIDRPYGVDSLKFSYIKLGEERKGKEESGNEETGSEETGSEETGSEEPTMMLHSLTVKDNEKGETVINKETNPIDENPYNLTSHDINLTVIEYQFKIPESNNSRSNSATADGKEGDKDEKSDKIEKRIIEINPYFQGGCYEL